MPDKKGDEMAQCDVCHVWYHRHCMDIPRSVRDVYMSNEQSESEPLLTVYLPACSSHCTALLLATTLEYVCTRGISPHSGLFMCLCVPE